MVRDPFNGQMIISLPQLEVFFFIFARIAGIFIQAPVLSSRSIPSIAKTAMAIWIAAVLWFSVPVNISLIPQSFGGFMVILGTEVIIGFLIGFTCNVIFLAIQSAGELIDLQMGLSVSQAFDPVFGATVSIVGRMLFFVAITTFLILNGHHLIFSILHQSFRILPTPATINLSNPALLSTMLGLGQILWTTALQLSGPILLIIFLSDFTFGIVSRVAPQVNVFMLGFQVKPALGLIVILITLSLFIKHIGSLLGIMGEEVLKLLIYLKV